MSRELICFLFLSNGKRHFKYSTRQESDKGGIVMTRQEFESLVNNKVSITSYSEARFCLELLSEMFPDWDTLASYYCLNGPEGIRKLYQVATRVYSLQNERERLLHLADTLKESLALCRDWRWPEENESRESEKEPAAV